MNESSEIHPKCTQKCCFQLTCMYTRLWICRRRQLLSIEEAWNLPISAEMSSRQQQQTAPQNRTTSAQSFQKTYAGGGVTPQGPPPPYPSPSGAAAGKKFKTESAEQKPPTTQAQPSFCLSQQQLQLLSYFQQNVNTLTPTQQVSLAFLFT